MPAHNPDLAARLRAQQEFHCRQLSRLRRMMTANRKHRRITASADHMMASVAVARARLASRNTSSAGDRRPDPVPLRVTCAGPGPALFYIPTIAEWHARGTQHG